MNKSEYKRILSLEVLIQDHFETHLNTFSNLTWYSPLRFTEDKKGNHNMVLATVNGSIGEGALEPSSNTHTGDAENAIFEIDLSLTIETTLRLMDETDEVAGRNLHQDKIAETRYAMMHGILGQSISDDFDIIGYLEQGQTTLGVNDSDNIMSELNYSFKVGIKSDAWPSV
jgi:hypothetical protein